MPRLTVFLSFFLVASGLGGRAQEAEPLLTQCAQVRALSREQAAQGLPVRIRGVVTFVQDQQRFVVADDTGIWIQLTQPPAARFQRSDEVEIAGCTGEGYFAPVVLGERFRSLRSAPLPLPRDLTAAAVRSGELDCQLVRVKGVVRRGMIVSWAGTRATALIISTAHGLIACHVFGAEFAAPPSELDDAEVEITGVCLTIFNVKGQFQGVRVAMNSPGDLRVIRPAPGEAFDVPPVALRNVLRFSPDGRTPHRRRVSGTVTLSQPGEFFFLQEGPHALRVNTRQTDRLAPGDRVEASGFLDLVQQKARLEEAVFRRLGPGQPPEPVEITVEQALHPERFPPAGAYPDFDDRLIGVRGRLLTIDGGRGEGARLNLERDGTLIPVEVTDGASFRRLASLAPGSELRVRGVCALTYSEPAPVLGWSRPIGLRVLARGAEDIEVIQRASWWTAARLWTALAAASAVLLGAALWILLLRRTVARRSQQFATEMKARRDAAIEFQATLRERNRLAANLHDTLLQTLGGIGFQIEACEAEAAAPRKNGEQAVHLPVARRMLDHAVDELRDSVWALRSLPLHGLAFPDALRSMAERAGAGRSVRIEIRTEGDLSRIPDFVAGNLLLVAQEAVHNALKHAQPHTVTLAAGLADMADRIALTVRDDGAGFTPGTQAGAAEGHFGLTGVRERIERLNGTLRIDSEPGRGTTIHIEVPLRAYDEDLA